MVDEFVTAKGMKRGQKPNPVQLLFKQYQRWCELSGCDAVPLTDFKAFFERLRGYTKQVVAGRECYLANKYVVCKSATVKIRRKPRRRACPHCGQPYLPKKLTT
jgi:hypothetical protein